MPALQARTGLPARNPSGDVALFIDWENLKISLSQVNLRPNVSSLRETAETFGRLVIATAYADWQEDWHQSDPENLYAAGMEPVYVPTRVVTETSGVRRRKNSVDVKLTADCVECCHNHPNIGTFVLVSGDGDFIHMVNTLRPYGKQVVAIGVSWSTSPRLADRVDRFLYYDQDVDPVDVPQYKLRSAPGTGGGDEEELRRALDLVVEIVRSSQHGDRALLSWIKNELLRRQRQFDEARLGFAKFKLFMREAERRGLLRIVEDGLVDWAYLPAAQEAEGLELPTVPALEPVDETALPAVIRFADGLESRSPYVAFMYLVDQVQRAAVLPHLSRDQLMALLNEAVDNLIFLRGVYMFDDPLTGLTKNIRTLVLNREHPAVRATLSAVAEGEAPAQAMPDGDGELHKMLVALEHDPENTALLMSAARRHYQLRQYEQAIEYQRRALAHQPDNVEYACLLARTLSAAGRRAEAVALCGDTAARAPEHPLPHVTLGGIFSAGADAWADAAGEFRRAFELLGDHNAQKAQLLLNIARCHEHMGNDEAARQTCEEGLAMAPAHPGLLDFRAFIALSPAQRAGYQLAKQAAALAVQPGHEAETMRIAQEAIDAAPGQYLPHYALGEVYQRLRRLRAAAENMEKAASLCNSPGTQAAIHQKLSRLYARLGETERSQIAQTRADALGADKIAVQVEEA